MSALMKTETAEATGCFSSGDSADTADNVKVIGYTASETCDPVLFRRLTRPMLK